MKKEQSLTATGLIGVTKTNSINLKFGTRYQREDCPDTPQTPTSLSGSSCWNPVNSTFCFWVQVLSLCSNFPSTACHDIQIPSLRHSFQYTAIMAMMVVIIWFVNKTSSYTIHPRIWLNLSNCLRKRSVCSGTNPQPEADIRFFCGRHS